MAPPNTRTSPWLSRTGFANSLFDSREYELYEEDEEYVLSVEMPGLDREEITVSWNEGVLNVAAEHEDDQRGGQTMHYRFRFPQSVDDEGIVAEYTNGILEVRVPKLAESGARGKEIEIKG